MKTLLITGYTAFDLGIFDEKDIKISIIKKALKLRLEAYLDNGLNWVIFTGSLGFEYWALQVSKELQKDYDFFIASIFPFETHGKNWNQANQAKLQEFKNVDYVKYAYESYENPSQFRQYNDFLLENSDGALVLYDEENETKLRYITNKMQKTPNYNMEWIRFEDLQEICEEMNNM
ncbi:SLOG family protein [Lactococcus ileimucosae]|uniref:SLOG family protein n=1 Tax=Lactococcus ileimucosae TaxID=2941329 RepID=UPI0020435BDF|nr:SLOG family protein [Lactococcus ileimucosae]